MVEDTKMTESGGGEETKAKTEKETTTPDATAAAAAAPPPLPPLQAAAQRLERLLGGSSTTTSSDKDRLLDFYTNPVKVVRRWLGTSSGAAANATADDVQAAAAQLLDPAGPCAAGRNLLVASSTLADSDTKMKDEEDDEDEEKKDSSKEPSYLTLASARQVESWLLSLAVRLLWKDGQYPAAFSLAQQAIDISLAHLEGTSSTTTTKSTTAGLLFSSSSLFPLLARLYRWRSLVAENLRPDAAASGGTVRLHSDMARAHNTASLRRDADTQATLLNCLLRELLRNSQVEQAEKLLSNSTFPETASNNQLCRYLYYSGRIQALRLEYTTSYSNLSQCLRKAPTNTGIGFRIAAQRLLVVVQLLMGEIPERHVFFTRHMRTELAPYLAITQAVRRGDLAIFTAVVSQHAARLQKDGTYTLISRLAHQVVKAGLRKLHVSYSRLSLQDVADRLGLPSAQTAEYVVAKAVRDGVLDATIHHAAGYVQSHDLVDVYVTAEPTQAFHRRIAYCLTVHNDAVRGMRYPPDAYKKQLEASRSGSSRGRKNEPDKTDEEKAKELEDEMEEDY